MFYFQFHNSEDAKKALEQLNGFELAGRPMKVNHVTDRNDNGQGNSFLDLDEKERTGVELGKSIILLFNESRLKSGSLTVLVCHRHYCNSFVSFFGSKLFHRPM